MTPRPSKDTTFMAIAYEWAKQSTCTSKIAVGAVLVNELNQVIASGYNGSPRGMEHCDDVGCDDNGTTHRVLHAEMNAVIQCSINGVSSKGSRAYVTHTPCLRCSQVLIQAGVIEVVYDQEYGDTDPAVGLLQRAGIKVRSL